MLQLPAAIARSRRERTRRTVDCAVICRVGLSWNSPVVDIELSFDNRAKDHRLRAVFPTPVQTDTIVSDGHFFLNHRAIDQPSGEGWLQPPSGTFPQQDFSLVQDGTCGLAVFNRGLTEVAPFRTPSGAGLHVTLLRAVGWLSRGDFPTRGYTAVGPTVPTPDAQCLCAQRFRYAVVPFAGDFLEADIKGLSERYRAPVVGIQGVQDQLVPGGRSFLQKETVKTSITAIKKHEVRDTLVVRLFNLTSGPVKEVVTLAGAIRGAWRINLLEERELEMVVDGTAVPVTLGPHEIATLEIDFAG